MEDEVCDSIGVQTSSNPHARYHECATEAAQSKVFATLKDLGKEERTTIYKKFGLWEKAYTLGVINYTIDVVFIARFPEHYWWWHMLKAFVFLPWRWVRFHARDMEWLMADFCYANTYFTVIACLLACVRVSAGITTFLHKYNYELIRGGFAFANGALVLSVPMFGNKLVFHEVDNTTSMYIHLSPALFMWTLRWGGGYGTSRIEKAWPTFFQVCRDMNAGDTAFEGISSMFWDSGPCAGTVWQFVIYPAIWWVCLWGVPYYIVVFCIMKGWLERHNKETLFLYTVNDPSGNGRIIVKLPECLQPLGYMLQHFIYTMLTAFLSIAMWKSFVLHTAFLIAIVVFGIHNGSTFMFRVVAARHVQGVVTEVASYRTSDYHRVE